MLTKLKPDYAAIQRRRKDTRPPERLIAHYELEREADAARQGLDRQKRPRSWALHPGQARTVGQAVRRAFRYLVRYVGVIAEQDGVDLVVGAMEHIVNIACLIIGGGPEARSRSAQDAQFRT